MTGDQPMADAVQQDPLSLVNRPELSQNGGFFTGHFSNGDAIVNEVHLKWVRRVKMDKLAKELVDLHRCSKTLEQVDWVDLAFGFSKTCDASTVTHLGQGVFVQDNKLGIDPDSSPTTEEGNPKTITTVTTRTFAINCLEMTRKKRLVLGTGQPRIGKTRSALAYTLQELLWRGEAVIRVGHKDSKAYLFLPQFDGSYKVWSDNVDFWHHSRLVGRKHMYVLIDPPEKNEYTRAAVCDVVEYCSNNEETHLKNIEKDGNMLIMGMPKFDQILCMAPVLYDESKFWIEGSSELQRDTNDPNGNQLFQALYYRCSLVGCVPGIVFNGSNFIKRLKEIKEDAVRECNARNFRGLLSFHLGGKVGKLKASAAVMSRFFLVEPSNDPSQPKTFLNPATSFYIQEELRTILAGVTGANAFEFEDICAMLLKGGNWNGIDFPPRSIVCGANLSHTTKLITVLKEGSMTTGSVVVRAPNCYPILDFATARNVWFNAKVGASTPKVSLSAFVTVMCYLGFAQVENNQLVLSRGVPGIKLVLIRNNGDTDWTFDKKLAKSHKDMDSDQIAGVFKSVVTVTVLNTAVWSPSNVFDARMAVVRSILDLQSVGRVMTLEGLVQPRCSRIQGVSVTS